MQASPLLMYAAALDHGSKKYTTYELMISCCPIGSDPVCCLYLPRTGTDPCLFITLPLAGGHKSWSLAYYWYC